MFERLDGLAIVETHFNKEVDQASYYIEKLVKDRLLTQQHLTGNIIDVCCGYGGASFVLAKDSANVTAVDNNPNCIEKSRVNARIGGRQLALACQDCSVYLNSLPPSSVDLITAFMFGPDLSGELLRAFYPAAQHALKSNGRLLIVSDFETLGSFMQVSGDQSGTFMKLDDLSPPFYIGGKDGLSDIKFPPQDAQLIRHIEHWS